MNLHHPKFNRAESNQVGEPGGMMRTTDEGADKIKLPDWSPGDVIWADSEGYIILDDGIETWNPERAKEFLQREWLRVPCFEPAINPKRNFET